LTLNKVRRSAIGSTSSGFCLCSDSC